MQLSELSNVYPEIILATMTCIILVSSPFFSKRTPWISYLLCQTTLLVVLCLLSHSLGSHPKEIFDHTFVVDNIGTFLKMLIIVFAVFAFIYARKYVWERNLYGIEYFVLCLFSILGMMVLVSAYSLITLYLGLELLALPLYALIAMAKSEQPDKQAPEAAMKYFVMGAIASGMLLYGMSLLYGMTGTLEITKMSAALAQGAAKESTVVLLAVVFVVVGLAFKLGAVPFHMWIPDIYQGAPTSVTLFIGTLPELAAFGMAIRLLMNTLPELSLHWQHMLIAMSVLSMALGNIVAIAQINLKRMLAYSTIGHVGFLLLGLIAGPETGYSAAFSYVIIYTVMALGAFGMIIALSRNGFEAENISDFQGLGTRHPWLAFLMLLILLSLAGVPPTLGFYAKFLVLEAVIDAGFVWLAATAVVFSVIAAYYYLGVIRAMFFEPAPEPLLKNEIAVSPAGVALLSINGLAVLLLGIYPAPILQAASYVLGSGY